MSVLGKAFCNVEAGASMMRTGPSSSSNGRRVDSISSVGDRRADRRSERECRGDAGIDCGRRVLGLRFNRWQVSSMCVISRSHQGSDRSEHFCNSAYINPYANLCRPSVVSL